MIRDDAESDDLLLATGARRIAAQVSEERPFGVPGRPLGRSGYRVGFTAALGALTAIALGRAVVAVEHELVVLLVAAFVAIGLEPAVDWLTRRGMRRVFAVLVISLIAVGLFAGFAAQAIPPIANETTQLVAQAPTFVHDLQDKNTELGRLNAKYHVQQRLQKLTANGLSGQAVGGLLSAGKAVLSFAFEALLVLVLVLYFLADFPNIKRACYRLVPRHRRPRVGLLGDEILSRVGGYVLGNVATSVVAIIGSYVLLRILGVPYALVLSVFIGVLDLVPLVGSTIGGAIVALIAFATVSLTAAIVTVIYHVVYRLFEDYLLNPRVLRHTVDVKPVVTVVAVIIGAALLGIVGALIAVPVAAAIQLIVTEVIYPQTDSS